MDKTTQRPPRAARPPSQARPTSTTNLSDNRPPLNSETSKVSFVHSEEGQRKDPVRLRNSNSGYAQQQTLAYDPEGGGMSGVSRKKSMVKAEREKIEPGHPQWHYRNHVAQLEQSGTGRVMASTTGNAPLRRGRSLLAREEDIHESGLSIFKRGTIRRRRPSGSVPISQEKPQSTSWYQSIAPGPKGPWMLYCWLITCCIPQPMMRCLGLRSPEQQRAWREKIGLISVILALMAGVGFLTFGFTDAVCNSPPNRYAAGTIQNGSVIIHGMDYDFSNFKHPAAGSTFNGQTNPLFSGGWNLAGNDASFMFQKVNQNCLGIITRGNSSGISGNGDLLDWYFPCNIYNQHGTSPVNNTGATSNTNCHITNKARNLFNQMNPLGQVYYTWDQVTDPTRNLAVFEGVVVDLNLLQWLPKPYVSYPSILDDMSKATGQYNGRDLSMLLLRTNQRQLGHCLQDVITVGFIDTSSIGCVASQVVLYMSLVFIVGVVAIKFAMAVMFAWFFSQKLGNFPRETYEQRMQRSAEIENWTNDIYRPAPSAYRPNVGKNGLSGNNKRKTFFPTSSRFTPSDSSPSGGKSRPATTYGSPGDTTSMYKRPTTVYSMATTKGGKAFNPSSYLTSRSTTTLGGYQDSTCPFPLNNVVPQPPPDYEPFNFPLAHTICLVTAYSESEEGLRTTLDSLATTDYPNSHKLIVIIADGMVKGHGNKLTTPDICLTMMKDFVIPPNEVEANSYLAIADGHKRHNMAKVFAGFYHYDNATVERSKQQRVPIVVVAKTGNPLEKNDKKPGNRGKRDSQIVLMAFLQKVMFDERMTAFEYEFFNSIWRVSGISPDRYELALCVDADTKVFPDSLTRMISCMVIDEEIMGLCGETKIANKGETFVTMMQVFEYYISHHMTKAFESMFGGVTCLPGCFSMYRIKAPKGDTGYWVPILANPDVVEHYSENVVDTLHKKNLLLLGEDRYLTTLMLKTFPKRKTMFCPQAVCKTVVPDTFRVLLSQRRRWINSTVHNLAELLFVRDLCGTFCFSMQFVVGMELAGTLVLPAAIAFTLYLIGRSIYNGVTNSGSSTLIPLILLGIILGLPGLLIVITSRKVAYVGWMLIYLLSLPIWNGLLPAYSFWHFDDFSWGETRKVTGEGKGGGGEGDKEGEFDSTHIVLKRWAEFERDRRWRNGTQSRDSGIFDRKTESQRYSMASMSDTFHAQHDSSPADSAGSVVPRPRHDSNALLTLPTPLSVQRPTTSSSTGFSRSSEDAYYSEGAASSNTRLVPLSGSGSPADIPDSPSPRYPSPGGLESQVSRAAGGSGAILRQSAVSNAYPGETVNPFSTPEAHVASGGYEELIASPTAFSPSEVEEPFFAHQARRASLGASPVSSPTRVPTRGVTLSDNGPVAGSEPVRRVARPSKRPTSQSPGPNTNRYSRGSTYASLGGLPPGAAAPQSNPSSYNM